MRKFKFDVLDSTNNYLKNKSDVMDYDVVIAETQTAGRGRRGNEWKSDNGSKHYKNSQSNNSHIDLDRNIGMGCLCPRDQDRGY